MTDKKQKLRRKISDLAGSIAYGPTIENDNTKESRDKLMRLNHYFHVLFLMGENLTEAENQEQTMAQACLNEMILREPNKKTQHKDVVKANLISVHTNVYYIAEYFYEKASKDLCQMMITIMDYILWEKAGTSVLLKEETERSYLTLLSEITALNEDYTDAFFYLKSYDFCTDQIADYIGIPEYREVIKEHCRIIENGLPKKVFASLDELESIVGVNRVKAEILQEVRKVIRTEPETMDLNKECFRKIIKERFAGSLDGAMTMFGDLVIEINCLIQNNQEAEQSQWSEGIDGEEQFDNLE